MGGLVQNVINQFAQVVATMENVMVQEDVHALMDILEMLVKFLFVIKNGHLVQQKQVVVLLLILVNALKVGLELIVHNQFALKLVIQGLEINVFFQDNVHVLMGQKDWDVKS
jgi:hypothetical protein